MAIRGTLTGGRSIRFTALSVLVAVFAPLPLEASCPPESVTRNLGFHNGWGNIHVEELTHIDSVMPPGGGGGNDCAWVVIEPNIFRYRRCGGAFTFIGPPAVCEPSDEPPPDGETPGDADEPGGISQQPLAITWSVPPMVLLSMSNDHQLYFEAYQDYSDLTGDGAAERTYNHQVDYYGYFDSFKCYEYSGSVFEPVSFSLDKYCDGQWSGNFLNYLSMARIDVIRKLLYGGRRSTDSSSETILERTYLPNDSHSWVRYYEGEDLPRLTPFSLPQASTAVSNTIFTVPSGSKNANSDRRWIQTSWRDGIHAQVGDQVTIRSRAHPGVWMTGVVLSFSEHDGNLRVQVTSSHGAGTTDGNWSLTNDSRRGVTFCNTTVSNTRWSQDVTDPPLLRVARGNYSLWTANERWQCRWGEERRHTGHTQMRIGGIDFSNGNDMGETGLAASAENPERDHVGMGSRDYAVRARACVPGMVYGETCKRYPSGNLKPVGLLQLYGDEDVIRFGLVTGSYARNKSGGVLRREIGSMRDEINVDTTGTIRPIPARGGIVGTLDRFRLFGYDHNTGYYNPGFPGDNCPWGLSSFSDGRCSNWGNPQSEIFLEGLRYLAGRQPSPEFMVSGTDRIPGLPALTDWKDPLDDSTWCASLRIIHFNSSISSYDSDQLNRASEIGASSVSYWTDLVGAGEGIHHTLRFVGETGAANNQLCTPKTVTNLSSVRGLCPLAPRLGGSYQIAGLAHYAHTQSIRDDLRDSSGNEVDVQVETIGVALAPALPRIEIPKPGQTEPSVTLLPACRNSGIGGNCAFVDFRVIEQDTAAGTGSFFVQWEDSEQGGDYDMDMNGLIRYRITNNDITVTTSVFSQSTSRVLAFGYVISGTTQDGFHAHSGVNGFEWTSSGTVPGCSNCRFDDPASSHTFTLGSSPARLLEEPLWYAAKWGGFNKPRSEHDPQFPADRASWDASGDGLPDNYFFAIDPGDLVHSLDRVFRTVAQDSAAIAGVVANSTEVRPDGESIVYQARFDSRDWSGDMWALEFMPVTMDFELRWKASEELPVHGERAIFTHDGEEGVPFAWSELSAQQRTSLESADVLSYLRGDKTLERQHGGAFRDRSTAIGSVVHSTPIYHGPGLGFGYPDASYAEFRRDSRDADPVVYVGSNAGKLHAIDASTGEEAFAYVPRSVIPRLRALAEPDYEHRFTVDGQQYVGHAKIDGDWRAVLIGGLAAGGRGLYALDVTDPKEFSEQSVLWEVTSDELPDLGHTYGRPTIGQLADGRWAAVFGNGYDSATGEAVLFVLDIGTGELIRAIRTGAVGDNGLSAPAFATDAQRRLTYGFAGDLKGNLWKFDLAGSNTNQWDVAYKVGGDPRPLFRARGPNGEIQSITAEPTVGRYPEGGLIVFVGTGQYFRTGDNVVPDNPGVQTMYGIRDFFGAIEKTRQDDFFPLKRQEIVAEGVLHGTKVRVVSDEPIEDTAKGWYLDLLFDSASGERVVNKAMLLENRLEFVSLSPSTEPCEVGGTSLLYALDALSGGRLPEPVFDIDRDGAFDHGDMILVGDELVAPSGMDPGVGIVGGSPAIIRDPVTGLGFRVISGTIGPPRVEAFLSSAPAQRRHGWRQLR